ncbi:MAG: hypothetical protein SF052_06865 [Bacteroidia bacterium]|nr:hypothetical protein [Bacteroidia bacterium]
MDRFEKFAEELRQIVPFTIRYKDESWIMQVINVFVMPFCPEFLSRFTTVIGNTIYFPNPSFIRANPESAMRVLAHEVVHILDMDRWTPGFFMGLYLFPQIFFLGVFLFPFIGLWSLLFLVFLLPLPAPFRSYFEIRGYAMDLLTIPPHRRKAALDQTVKHFTGWNYYKMFPFESIVRNQLNDLVNKTESGEEKNLMKILLVYELVVEE